VYEDCACESASAGGLAGSTKGGIIVDDQHFDRDAFGAGHLGREAEVQPVAGVIFNHQQGS